MRIGTKYFRYLNDNVVEIARVTKIKPGTIFFKVGDKKVKAPKETFLETYTELMEHGMFTIALVSLEQNNKDVVMMIYRRQELEDNDSIPYVICRQNALDFFTDQAEKIRLKTDDIPIYLGVSATKDNIPEDIPMDALMVCNDIEYSENFSIYRDDEIDDILGLIKERNIFERFFEDLYKRLNGTEIRGVNKSLRDLIDATGFERDLLYSFNIIPVNFEIKIDENHSLEYEQMLMFQNYLNKVIFNTYVTKYAYHINLNLIKRDYILVKDNSKNIYIIAYDTDGTPINSNMERAANFISDEHFNIDIG